MTGIMLPPEPSSSPNHEHNKQTRKPSKDDTPAMRYPSIRAVPERYSIIQLGICLFFQEDMDMESSQERKRKKEDKLDSNRIGPTAVSVETEEEEAETKQQTPASTEANEQTQKAKFYVVSSIHCSVWVLVIVASCPCLLSTFFILLMCVVLFSSFTCRLDWFGHEILSVDIISHCFPHPVHPRSLHVKSF